MGQALIDAWRAARSGERFVAAPGARLRVRVEGSGPVLVLLHGWALDLDMWTPQFEALSSEYRVVAFDRRGFGLSTGTPSIERDAEDLALILDDLSVSKVAVLGMSQAARVALRFALERPQRVACLALDGAPALRTTESADLPLERFRELATREGLDAFRNAWRRHPLTQLCSGDASALALIDRMVSRYPGVDLQNCEQAVPTPALMDLNRLQAPTLLINGALDTQERLDAAQDLAQRLSRAVSVRIPGAAHLPNLDQAQLYNDALRAFLRRCASNHTSWSE